ncbi:DsbA family oxidoreductase [Limosilactobacillus fastidiosus]|uniref:DsbA family oxidoreductase n=1 Tax=Limosilactobacillus fastidiosus TaxID=2759855 RepID=A0A7W3U059_9LACO|nr:DsbA family oxidoreductase [Limosilactobacillus fastidiosus]MBB1086210.1 DsbA family oxidoreductase [Limosilactobacillus fastidiosus]MCD7086518.1 DsbA family oxidoreductase [Limosilactobacillus fastidiosus]MCD7114959.1 DsbA family oxidoreductase [Limosilactobacillus fastidiosus]MCD7116646.1 DsbA family oxidoreductase [Limosilactobacillus fastidiosus]
MVKISVWTDYACPFCYIAEARVDNLIKEMGIEDQVEFDYHSFELYPDAPKDVQETTIVRFAKKYGLTEEEAADRIDKIAEMGRAEGLDFNYSSTLNTNSMDAHRLTQYVNSLGDPKLTKQVSDLLFDAYFGKNLKLADHDVLMDVAKKAGLDLPKVKEVLESNAFYDEVRADENFIMKQGVNAVPFFIIDNKGIMGAQPKNIFKQVITEALQNDQNAN